MKVWVTAETDMPVAEDIERKKADAKPKDGASRFESAIVYAATEQDIESEIELTEARMAERMAERSARFSEIAASVDDAHGGERIQHVILHGVTSLETAAIELEAVAAQRPRVSDPVRHIVLSYDTARGESPTFEEIDADVRVLLRERGMTNGEKRGGRNAVERFQIARGGEVNPFVAVVHGDTDVRHAHIVVSTVSADGTVNSDFRRKIANEHACSAIAIAHDWEIVRGRHNFGKVAEQALARGATEDEIEALRRKEAATFDRLLEQKARGEREKGPDRSAEEKAAKRGRRGKFVEKYAERIKAAFSASDSFRAFVAACKEIGVAVKFEESVDRKGRPNPRAAFSLIEAKGGDTGTRVGVPGPSLKKKFGAGIFGAEAVPVDVVPINVIETNIMAAAEVARTQKREKEKTVATMAIDARGILMDLIEPRRAEREAARTAAREQAVRESAAARAAREAELAKFREARAAKPAVTRGPLSADQKALAAVVVGKTQGQVKRPRFDATLGLLASVSATAARVREARQERAEAIAMHIAAKESAKMATITDRVGFAEKAMAEIDVKRAQVMGQGEPRTPVESARRDRQMADLDMRARYAVHVEKEDAGTLSRKRGWDAARGPAGRAAFDDETARTKARLERNHKNREELFKIFGGGELRQEKHRQELRALDRQREEEWKVFQKRPFVVEEAPSYESWLNRQSGAEANLARARLAEESQTRDARKALEDCRAWLGAQKGEDAKHALQDLGETMRTGRWSGDERATQMYIKFLGTQRGEDAVKAKGIFSNPLPLDAVERPAPAPKLTREQRTLADKIEAGLEKTDWRMRAITAGLAKGIGSDQLTEKHAMSRDFRVAGDIAFGTLYDKHGADAIWALQRLAEKGPIPESVRASIAAKAPVVDRAEAEDFAKYLDGQDARTVAKHVKLFGHEKSQEKGREQEKGLGRDQNRDDDISR